MTEEELERLKQIQRWRINYVSANRDAYVDLSRAFGEIDFLLSLLDSQAAHRPVGWQSAQQRADPRVVTVTFENRECAEAFISGIEPAIGPIVAATRMRDACVEKVEAMADEWTLLWQKDLTGDHNDKHVYSMVARKIAKELKLLKQEKQRC